MAAKSRLGQQIEQLAESFNDIGAAFALIGGLALASHRVIRATQDVDVLVDAANADSTDQVLRSIGYQCIHRSPDAGNYLRGDERVDLLYANRPIARRLLASAVARHTAFGDLRVVSLEGLIGLKLQGVVNDPIAGPVVRDEAPAYQGDPFELLDDLMVVVESLCPIWPPRDPHWIVSGLRL